MRRSIILSLILVITVINLTYTGRALSQTPTGKDSIALNIVPGGTFGYLNVSVWVCRTGLVLWNLGNSSFVFHYNSNALSNPSLIQTGIGNGGNYNATAIHPYSPGYEGIDITLPIQYGGTPVPASYTLVGTVQFQINNPGLSYQIYWNNIMSSVSADDWQTYPDMTNINPPTLTLNLTALLQGFYNGTTMVPDNVTVQLRNSTATYSLVESKAVMLNSSGAGSLSFEAAANGIPYYIVLRFNNGIETWSALPQTFAGSSWTYDFTTAATQAYGGNMIHVGTKWCVYVGDVNQDGVVDALDMIAIDNDVAFFVTGNVATDLNGDLAVDALDMILCDNNTANFVAAVKPPGALTSRLPGPMEKPGQVINKTGHFKVNHINIQKDKNSGVK